MKKLFSGHEKMFCTAWHSKKMLVLLGVLLVPFQGFANIIITQPSNGTTICANTAANGTAPAWTTLNNIIITENANGDFPNSITNATITLTTPSGWVFNSGVLPTITATTGRDISSIGIAFINTSTLQITWTTPAGGGGSNAIDIITISGLQVQASTTASAAGPIYCSARSTAVAGLTAGTQAAGTVFASLALIPSPSIVTQPLDQTVNSTPGTALFTVTANDATAYQWQESTDGGTTWHNIIADGIMYWNVNMATLIITDPTLVMNGYRYRCLVSGNCTPAVYSDGNATLTVELAYCTSNATSTSDEDIFNVKLGTLDNTSDCATTGGAGSLLNEYSNYSGLTATDLLQGSGNVFSVQVGKCGTGSYDNALAIFIDFNQDQDFDDTGEKVYVSAASTSGAHTETGSINIPMDAVPGTTRMRVVCVETGTPGDITACNTYTWGETEDYTVNIVGCTPTPPSCASGPSPADATGGQNTCAKTLTWTAPASSGCNGATSYDVYFGTTNPPPFMVNTTSTSYYTGTSLNSSTTYYWKVVPKNASGDATSCPTWSFSTNNVACLLCTHTLRISDTYGDGWNGGTVDVLINGSTVLSGITLAAGFGPEDYTFNANSTSVITVVLIDAGSYAYERRVEIISGTGASILGPVEPIADPGISTNGCCTASVPGTASGPVPANATTNMNPCIIDLSWTAPASGSCNGPTSYDLYFGTSATPPFLVNLNATSYSLPFAVQDNTTYYWQIVPKNGAGGAASCPVWSFTTSTTTNGSYCFYGNTIDYPDGGSNCAQLTPDSPNQNGCAWNRNQISFANAFDYSVDMYFGTNNDGADGCAFVFQNSPLGISQCGDNGGQLGAGGIADALVIEFDTYDNDNPGHIYDMAADHTAIEIDGNLQDSAPLCGPVQANPTSIYLTDGLTHNLRVTWDPATQEFCIYVDGSQRLCCTHDFINTVFGGDPDVWWGFTAATGVEMNQQYFCPITLPMPVSLIDFSSGCQQEKPRLDWYTASEINNDYFTLERSDNGEDFYVVAEIAGAGNSNEIRRYSWTDETAAESNPYYRLSQTDLDGTVEVLGTLRARCAEEEAALNITMATGVNNTLASAFELPYSGLYTLEVFDVLGRQLTALQKHFDAGRQEFELPVPTMNKGMYILRLSNQNLSTSRKFTAY